MGAGITYSVTVNCCCISACRCRRHVFTHWSIHEIRGKLLRLRNTFQLEHRCGRHTFGHCRRCCIGVRRCRRHVFTYWCCQERRMKLLRRRTTRRLTSDFVTVWREMVDTNAVGCFVMRWQVSRNTVVRPDSAALEYKSVRMSIITAMCSPMPWNMVEQPGTSRRRNNPHGEQQGNW